MDIINALGELAVEAGWFGVQAFFYGIAAVLAVAGVGFVVMPILALLTWIFNR